MRKRIKNEVKNFSIFATHNTSASLNNWTKLIDAMKKVTGTNTVESNDYLYFKVYYTDNLTVEDKNEIFISISSLPLSENHTFFGVREYLENHEMCFVFKKK